MSLRLIAPVLMVVASPLALVSCVADDAAPADLTSSDSAAVVTEQNYQGSGMDRFSYASRLGNHEALVYAAEGCRVGDGGSDCPVIVFHHGNGQNGGVQRQFSDCCDVTGKIKGGYRPRGLIIAAPARYLGWSEGAVADATTMQDALLDALAASYKVRPGAVHVTGLSGGSGPVLAYASKRPHKIASYSVFAGVAGFEACQGTDTRNCVAPADMAALVALPSFWGISWGDPIAGIGSQDGNVSFLLEHGGSLSDVRQYLYCRRSPVARDSTFDWFTRVAWQDANDPAYCGEGLGHVGWHYGYSTEAGAPHAVTWWDWARSTFEGAADPGDDGGDADPGGDDGGDADPGSGGACVGAGGVLKNSCFTAVDEGKSEAASRLLDGTTGNDDATAWLNGKWLFSSDYPAAAYIDLKQPYNVTKLEYFAGNLGGSSELEISYATGSPGNWTVAANSKPAGWSTWSTGTTKSFTARYVRVRFLGYGQRFNVSELRLTGSPL
ncbi:discoidin domain-containing protein [Sorangium sp. So ce1182]|uniref:discoidin domain-containing protein n=1 Tax=Sorangium sp. So ce1182 TaxID=3133334 RepID=UPI003F623A54